MKEYSSVRARRHLGIILALATLATLAPAGLVAQAAPATLWPATGRATLAATVQPRFTDGFVLASAAAATAPAASVRNHAGLHVVDYRQPGRRRGSRIVTGAVAGLIIGAGATYLILNQGGSTSLCDRTRNQDAIDASYCAGLYAAGGAVGAGIGAYVGSRIGR